MKRLLSLALFGQLAMGCGGGEGDGGIDAPAVVDAPAIDSAVQGWSPRALVMIDGPDEDIGTRKGPALSPDGRELYFAHRAFQQVFRATRATASGPWGPAQRVDTIATGRYQVSPRVSADGMSLYFASDGPAQGASNVYVSTRASLSDPWGAPAPVDSLNGGTDDLTATPCLGGSRFVFESNREGPFRLFEAEGTTVRALTEINGAGPAFSPFVTEDCLALYYTIRVGGHHAIHVSRRTVVTDPWSAPELVAGLEDATFDIAEPWVSADQRHMVFVLGGLGGSPDRTLFESFYTP